MRPLNSSSSCSDLLQDQFLLAVVAELVGAEKVAVVEGRQVVDVDLSGLEEEEEGEEEQWL